MDSTIEKEGNELPYNTTEEVGKILQSFVEQFPHDKLGYYPEHDLPSRHHHKIGKEIDRWVFEMNIDPIKAYISDEGEVSMSQWMEKTSKGLHVDYENIHPFVDGNGRTGRIFMNWWRVKNRLPILVIHEGDEQWDYYRWFNEDE